MTHSNDTTMTAAQLRCVSDSYDTDGSVPYDSLEDFLAMCDEIHGGRPELRWQDAYSERSRPRPAGYYEGSELILEPVEG